MRRPFAVDIFGCPKKRPAILWMVAKSISHHLETMVETICSLLFTLGNRIIPGFLKGGARFRPSTVVPPKGVGMLKGQEQVEGSLNYGFPNIPWMHGIHSAPPFRNPRNGTIPLQIPTNDGFSHGFKVVRNGFCPSTVGLNTYIFLLPVPSCQGTEHMKQKIGSA